MDRAEDREADDAQVDVASRRPGVLGVRAPLLGAVALGGALGALARYGLSKVVAGPASGFPWATFAVNVSGSLVLGLLLTLVTERLPPTRLARPFAGTGFCGAYTTWSTLMVDADLLVKRGHSLTAAAYVGASLVAGLAAVYVGVVAGRLWPASERRT